MAKTDPLYFTPSEAPIRGVELLAKSPYGDTVSFGAGSYTAVIIKPLDFLDKVVNGTAEAALTAALSKVPGGAPYAKQLAKVLENFIKKFVEQKGDKSLLGQVTLEFNLPLLNALDPEAWKAESVLHFKWSGGPNTSKFMLDTVLRSVSPSMEAAQRILDAGAGAAGTGTGRSTFWSDARVTVNIFDSNGNVGLYKPRIGLQKLVALKEGDGKVTAYNGIAVSPRYWLESGKIQVVIAGYVGVESKVGQTYPLGIHHITDKVPLGFEAGGYSYFSIDRENLYKDKDNAQYYLKKNGTYYKLWPELSGFIASAYGDGIQRIDATQRTETFQSLIKLQLDQIPLSKDDVSRVVAVARAAGDAFNSFNRPDVQDLGALLGGLSTFSGGPVIGTFGTLGALAQIYQNSRERESILSAQYENFLKSPDKTFHGFLVPALDAIAESVRVDTTNGKDTAAAAGKAVTLVTDIYHYCMARAIKEGKIDVNTYYADIALAYTNADGVSGISYRRSSARPVDGRYTAIAESLLYRGTGESAYRYGGGSISIDRPGKSALEVPFEGPQKFNVVPDIRKQANIIFNVSDPRQYTFDFRDLLKIKNPILWSKPISKFIDSGGDTIRLLNAIIDHRDEVIKLLDIRPDRGDKYSKLIESVDALDPRLGMSWNILNKLFALPVNPKTNEIATIPDGRSFELRWGKPTTGGVIGENFAFWQRFVKNKGDNLDQALGEWKKEYYDYLIRTSGRDPKDPTVIKACEILAQGQLDQNLLEAAVLLKRESLTSVFFGSKLLKAAFDNPNSNLDVQERAGLGTKFDVIRQISGGDKILENYFKAIWSKPDPHNSLVSAKPTNVDPAAMSFDSGAKTLAVYPHGDNLANVMPDTRPIEVSTVAPTVPANGKSELIPPTPSLVAITEQIPLKNPQQPRLSI
jgi:hypothetical protein